MFESGLFNLRIKFLLKIEGTEVLEAAKNLGIKLVTKILQTEKMVLTA